MRRETTEFTDSRGRFRFAPLPQFAGGSLYVEKEGFVSEETSGVGVGPESPRQEVEIELSRGASIAGRVADDRGEPVPGFQVFAKLEPRSAGEGRAIPRNDTEKSATAGFDGEYELQGLRPGTWSLVVSCRGVASVDRRTLDLEPEEAAAGVDFVVSSALSLEGEVVDAEGRPVAGAWVDLDDWSGTPEIRSDARGRFGFRGSPPGLQRVSIRCDGYAPLYQSIALPQVGARFVLHRGARLVGRIIDPGRARLPGGEVVVATEQSEPKKLEPDDLGRFSCALAPGRARVRVSVPGYAQAERLVEVAAGRTTEVAVELRPAGTLRGRVVSAGTGKPVEDAAIALDCDDGDSSVLRFADVTTDEEGAFEIESVPAGLIAVAARRLGFRSARVEGVRVAPGEVAEVALELAPSTGILGRVSFGEAPAPETPVTATHLATGRRQAATSDVRGRFELVDLEAGEYEVRAGPCPAWPGSQVAIESVTVRDEWGETVELDLAIARVRGQVRRGPTALSGAMLSFLQLEGSEVGPTTSGTTADEDGRYRAHLLGGADYLVVVRDEETVLHSAVVTVPPGTDERVLDITIPAE